MQPIFPISNPNAYEFVPYLGISWPYQPDRSVAGNALKLTTGVFDKGLGMHSEARLTYDLGGGYEWFEATVGLDEATGRQGSAGIQVLIDGKALDLGSAGDLTPLKPPRSLRLKIAGDARADAGRDIWSAWRRARSRRLGRRSRAQVAALSKLQFR